MDQPSTVPDRIRLASGLDISRMVTGLWQVADQERGGQALDLDAAARELAAYAQDGFDSFDMADHYGSAELIAGQFLRIAPPAGTGPRPSVFTKWCPTPGPMTREVVRAGVAQRLERLGVQRIDLLQFHWWTYEHPAWLDAMRELAALRDEGVIGALGVTNFNTDHLRVLAACGIPIDTNQVSFSVLDRRAAGDMAAFCAQHGIALLAYGTLAGGLISERWLGAPEPDEDDIGDWSKMKYLRFVQAIGGWPVLQAILGALSQVAARRGVSIANVATRWVLEQRCVAGVIVGARLGEREHRADNARAFSFALDAADHATLDAAFANARNPPADCGDEYRSPPFLTASGDLSHHLNELAKPYPVADIPGRAGWQRVDTGSVWEGLAGYGRAVRIGHRILVSGTTATHGNGTVVAPGDAAAQTVYILDKIIASIRALGGSAEDIVRTRIYLTDAQDWEGVARVHGRYFGAIRPANTLIQIAGLVGDYCVEIEAEAELA